MDSYYPEDSIAALATPWGTSALAVIRITGKNSLHLLKSLFFGSSGIPANAEGFTMHHGYIRDIEGEVVDEVMMAVYKAPTSYTGENSAEIFCHGSPAIIARLLELLQTAGFRTASPGEFTLRAFINGKMDLTQAEAVNEIVQAKTDRARAIALNRLSGSIEKKIRTVNENIARILSAVEVRIDYPDEEMEQEIVSENDVRAIERELENLLDTYGIGKIIQEGISAVLAGRTNAGKSTLFNRFLREERAIVSELHGTTRDYLEGIVSVKGIPIRLYDTAGFRSSVTEIEVEGIRRTDKIIQNAHFILYLVDAAHGLTDVDENFLHANDKNNRLIRIWNKTDVSSSPCPEGFIQVSALQGHGISELLEKIHKRVFTEQTPVDAHEPIIDSLRQKQLLEQALDALKNFRRGLKNNIPLDVLAIDLKEALDALGEITGEITSQDILNSIFSQFCVGK